jgi:hypothetical protein
MRLKLQLLLILSSLSLAFTSSQAKDIILPTTGVYKEIDTSGAREIIKQLVSNSPAEQEAAIKAIETSPDKYAPPVFYKLSSVLFIKGNRERAAFWFYAGQLRGRYDANRCADISARSAIAVMNQQFGGLINQYMFAHLDKLEKLVPEVIAFDKKTAHNYDHRWINLHGMGAIQTSLGDEKTQTEALSLPKAQWAAIEEQTRRDYLVGFKEALKQAKERAAGSDKQSK